MQAKTPNKKKKFGKKDEKSDEEFPTARARPTAVDSAKGPKSKVCKVNNKKLVYNFAKTCWEKGPVALRAEFRGAPRIAKFDEMPTFMKNNATGRNRYKDVGCVEDTRVKLAGMENDYIHANYVSTPQNEKRFICTQAPLEKTCADFWTMIMQESADSIIMLCNYVEHARADNKGDGKKKCCEYFPTEADQKMQFDDFTITCKSAKTMKMKIKTDTVIKETTLEVSSGKKKHRLKHFHWLDWPDRDVPNPDMAIIQLLDRCKDSKNPIVVHCSAGVGRTGVVVLIQWILDAINAGQEIPANLIDLVKDIRKQRNNSVQMEEQFFFVHMVLLNHFFEIGIIDESAAPLLEKYRADYQTALAARRQATK